MTQVGIIGGGSWASALAKIFSESKNAYVNWWMRNVFAAEHIKNVGNNPNYLRSVDYRNRDMLVSNDINEVVEKSEYIILAVPSAYLKEVMEEIEVPINNKNIFSSIKGVIPGNYDIVGEYLHNTYQIDYDHIGVITGPCHAEEVAMNRLSYLTIACIDDTKAAKVSDMMSSSYISTKISDDIFGTEYASVLKNIYAICAGICHGLGYGDNFQAVLMSNAIREIDRFVKEIHPINRDIKNSAYLGDLLVTGYSTFSRNRTFGNMIGKGYTIKSAMLEMSMIAEGYYSVAGVVKFLETKNKSIHIPITEAVYRILYKEEKPKQVIEDLCKKLD